MRNLNGSHAVVMIKKRKEANSLSDGTRGTMFGAKPVIKEGRCGACGAEPAQGEFFGDLIRLVREATKGPKPRNRYVGSTLCDRMKAKKAT